MTSSQEPLGQFQPNSVGNILGGWGFRFVQIRGKIRKILINLQKFSYKPLAGINALLFCMDHLWGKEIEVCSNEVPRFMY